MSRTSLSYSHVSLTGPDVTTKPSRRACPQCGSSVARVRRRFIDHLVSFVYPVYRYRCSSSFVCDWEGNLRHPPELGRWER